MQHYPTLWKSYIWKINLTQHYFAARVTLSLAYQSLATAKLQTGSHLICFHFWKIKREFIQFLFLLTLSHFYVEISAMWAIHIQIIAVRQCSTIFSRGICIVICKLIPEKLGASESDSSQSTRKTMIFVNLGIHYYLFMLASTCSEVTN